MPIYEYHCEDCDTVFEKLIRSISARVDVVCEQCGSGKVEKLVSGFAFSGGGKKNSGSSSCGTCSSHNCGSCGH